MDTDDVSASSSFFFKEWMCAERSHPSLHSFIYCHCLFWASRWDSNKDRAGWINYYDDEPHRQSSLNPIGLSAVCCSFLRRHYGIAASLWRALRESVCVCGWGKKWYRQAIDFTFCNWSFRNTKRKVSKMLKCFCIEWIQICVLWNLNTSCLRAAILCWWCNLQPACAVLISQQSCSVTFQPVQS